MHTALTPYIGRTIADYVLDHGPPANTVDLGPSKKGFQWLTTQRCTVSIVAHATKPDPSLADWVIEHWRWQGCVDAHTTLFSPASCCRDRPTVWESFLHAV